MAIIILGAIDIIINIAVWPLWHTCTCDWLTLLWRSIVSATLIYKKMLSWFIRPRTLFISDSGRCVKTDLAEKFLSGVIQACILQTTCILLYKLMYHFMKSPQNNYVKSGQANVRVGCELSNESWMSAFFNSCAHGQRGWELIRVTQVIQQTYENSHNRTKSCSKYSCL